MAAERVFSLPLRRAIALLSACGWRVADAENGVGYFEPIDASRFFSHDALANTAVEIAHRIRATIPGVFAWHVESDDEVRILIEEDA